VQLNSTKCNAKNYIFAYLKNSDASVHDMKPPTHSYKLQIKAPNICFYKKIAESHNVTPLLAKEAVHHHTQF